MARTTIPTTTDIPNSEIKDHSLVDEAVKLDAEYFNSKIKQAVDELAYCGTTAEKGDDIKNTICHFETADNRDIIVSGEKTKVTIGKLLRYCKDLSGSYGMKSYLLLNNDFANNSVTSDKLGNILGVNFNGSDNSGTYSYMYVDDVLNYWSFRGETKTYSMPINFVFPNSVVKPTVDIEYKVTVSGRGVGEIYNMAEHKRVLVDLTATDQIKVSNNGTQYGTISFRIDNNNLIITVKTANNVVEYGYFNVNIQGGVFGGTLPYSATANGLKVELAQDGDTKGLRIKMAKIGDIVVDSATKIKKIKGESATNQLMFPISGKDGKEYYITFIKK
jgi:hypothetical protein